MLIIILDLSHPVESVCHKCRATSSNQALYCCLSNYILISLIDGSKIKGWHVHFRNSESLKIIKIYKSNFLKKVFLNYINPGEEAL
jgi:hypothetical protein